MTKKRIIAVCIYIALLVVCLIAVYAVPSVRGLLEKTYIAEYGSLDITDEVSGFIVRDETVYVAAHDCTVERKVESNTLVKAKTKVVDITIDSEDEEAASESEEETIDVSYKYKNVVEALGEDVKSNKSGKTGIAGYVTYLVDGAEAKLSTDNLADLTMDDYKELTKLKSIETATKTVKKGEPIFKITRNHKWYLVFYIDNDAAAKYEDRSTVRVDIAGKQVNATIESIETGDSLAKVTLSCKVFFDGFLETRTLDTTVTLASAKGLILKDESIFTNSDGQKGVFVKNKLGQHIFKPISLKADDGTNSVAYSDIYVNAEGNFVETIGTYDEIVIEPTAEDLEGIGITQEEGEEDSGEGTEETSENSSESD